MRYLLNDERLTFTFTSSYVECHNYVYGYYQINEILSFAVIDLVFKIINQQKRKSIVLKKRKSIIHLLNYIDILNFNSNSSKFEITFPLENEYESSLIFNLFLYRRRYNDLHKNNLKVIEHKNSCIIRLKYDGSDIIQPKNVNLATMLMRILKKEEIDMIDPNGMIFYCIFLM